MGNERARTAGKTTHPSGEGRYRSQAPPERLSATLDRGNAGLRPRPSPQAAISSGCHMKVHCGDGSNHGRGRQNRGNGTTTINLGWPVVRILPAPQWPFCQCAVFEAIEGQWAIARLVHAAVALVRCRLGCQVGRSPSVFLRPALLNRTCDTDIIRVIALMANPCWRILTTVSLWTNFCTVTLLGTWLHGYKRPTCGGPSGERGAADAPAHSDRANLQRRIICSVGWPESTANCQGTVTRALAGVSGRESPGASRRAVSAPLTLSYQNVAAASNTFHLTLKLPLCMLKLEVATMTAKEAKGQLPDVTVVPTFGVFLACKTTGRNNAFATVTPTDEAWGGCSWQFSWDAIARAATLGSPLCT